MVLLYIVDLTIIGTSAGKVNRDRSRAATALASANLQTDPKKDVLVDREDYKVAIGLEWGKDGVITVRRNHALHLFRTTSLLVRSKRASVSILQEVVGLWTYAPMLRRPVLSMLCHTFKFSEEGRSADDTKHRLP